jgi:hypothetical protein
MKMAGQGDVIAVSVSFSSVVESYIFVVPALHVLCSFKVQEDAGALERY